MNVIEVNNLKKKYDKGFELNIDNLVIKSGQITGLIGENGAGKTTFIKLLLDIIKKDDGSIKIFNKDTLENDVLIKEDIGIVLDNAFFPEPLAPKDVNYSMNDIYKNWNSDKFINLLKEFKVPMNKKIKELSTGNKKKLEIAVALSHDAKLLILDEATSGLDPIVRNEMLDIFLKFIEDEDHSILMSTHITTDLEHIADNIIFINDGKVLFDEEMINIKDNYAIVKSNIDEFNNIDKEYIIKYKKNKYNYEILINNKNKFIKKYKDLVIEKPTIEDIMIIMVKGSDVEC